MGVERKMGRRGMEERSGVGYEVCAVKIREE